MQWIPIAGGAALNPTLSFRLDAARSRPDSLLGADPGAVWWSALLDLRDTSLDAFEAAVAGAFPGADPVLIVPDAYDSGFRAGVSAELIVSVFARPILLEALNDPANPFGVAGIEIGAALGPQDLLPGPPVDAGPDIDVAQDATIMVVIDDAIAIAHEAFCHPDGSTRIDLAYAMTAAPAEADRRSHGFTLGRRRIDALLQRHTRCGLLDEDGFYRAAGLVDFGQRGFQPLAQARSHGTHVASLAAGGAEGPVLCAMLPPRVTWDVSGQTLAPSLALALDVLLARARRYRRPDGRRAPVVVNFSYGTFDGPHDGTGLIPRMLEDRIARMRGQEVRIVLPAGNGNLSRTHAEVTFDAGQGGRRLDLSVASDDRTDSHLQFWMPWLAPGDARALIALRVTPPGGPESPPLTADGGTGYVLVDGSGREVARLTHTRWPWPTERGCLRLSLRATGGEDGPHAPAGRWRLDLAQIDLRADEAVQVWIARDETLPGYPPFGRQAFFDNACYRRVDAIGAPLAVDPEGSDCPVRRAGMLNPFATGPSPLVVAGLTGATGLLSDYSAAGPITPTRGAARPTRTGPDAAALSDDSDIRVGVLGAANRRGAFDRQSGTSVSAPLVSRFVAGALARGEAADRAWLRRAAAAQDGAYPAPKPAETRCGGGRLDLTPVYGGPPHDPARPTPGRTMRRPPG